MLFSKFFHPLCWSIAESLARYGNQLVPFVLIGLGILILLDSHTLEHRGLVVLTLVIGGLFILHLFRSAGRSLAIPVPTVKEP